MAAINFHNSLSFRFPSSLLNLIFLFGLTFQALSQNQVSTNYKLYGVVVDSTTSIPIPNVNVWSNHSNTITDADGNFALLVSSNDSIHFSHVSYQELAIKCPIKQQAIKIVLEQKISLLEEVRIYSFLSESAFKQKIIETIPVLSREEELAKINSKMITYLARYTPANPMDANENYINYMNGPQGVVIFSSKPSKGLIRAVKNVLNSSPPSYKRFFDTDNLTRTTR